jgi:hypothetical protein
LEYSEIVDSVKYVHLETTGESLVGRINQLHKDDSLLFILDKKQKSIFIFDDRGRYRNKINHIGRGPGEYISITSFDIDEDRKEICLLDDMQQKILRYTYKGEYLNEIVYKQSTLIRSIACLGSDYICFTPDYLSRTRDGIWEIDTLGSFVKEIKDVDSKYKFPSFPWPYYTSYEKDRISFYDCNTEEIYSITDDLKCEYSFDFKQKLPDEYHATDETVYTQDGRVRGSGDYFRIRKIAESELYYFLKFFSKFKGDVYVLFEKRTKKLFIMDSLRDDLDNTKLSNEVFSYSKDALAVVHWESVDANPSLQLLFMKRTIK